MKEAPRSPQPVNSKTYWDDRFSSNWEAFGGTEQSRQFMEALLKFLPAGIYEELASQELSLLDCGCAEGDGTAVLAQTFPRSQVAGFDFSSIAIDRGRARFPSLDLFVASFTSFDRMADVLISSNCFEHLDNPIAALTHLASRARRYMILLVPFLERFPPDPEHVRIVHATTFPERVAEGRLIHRILVPPLPVWSQNQLLLIYQVNREAGEIREPSQGEEIASSLASLALMVEGLFAAQADLERRLYEQEERRALRQAAGEEAAEQRYRSLAGELAGELARELAGELAASNAALEARWQQQNEELGALRQTLERLRGERLAELNDRKVELDLRREAAALQRKLVEASAAAEAARADARQALQEREQLLAELQGLQARLAALDSSLAVRSVHRLWSMHRRLFPPGTLRHRLYQGLSRSLKAPLLRQPEPGAEPAAQLSAPAPPPSGGASTAVKPDSWAELQLFEQRSREIGADMVVTLFSGTMLREDEGQRPTQLALSLSRRGIPVVFAYWRWDRDEWCAQDRGSDGIYQLPVDLAIAEPDRLAGLFQGCRRIALFEFPYPGFFEPLAALNAAGWITVYDVLDDWQEFHRVGQAVWYDEGFERHLITATDAVFAINGILGQRVKRLGGDRVQVVPNGFRPGIELARECRLLERGEVTVGYFGYLASAWFDWDLIVRAAYRKPGWRFYLIGYGGSPEGVPLPSNVVLLGKKPQRELASYAAAWDVAIVPFKPDLLAAGADPIKVYEYLAMGLPVVVTGVHPPEGSEGLVARAEGLEEFLERIREADRRPELDEMRKSYAAACTWDHRLNTILEAISSRAQRIAEKRSLFQKESS